MSVTRELTARTRLFALLGDPVAHSFSPTIQNAALRRLELEGAYGALRCSSADAPGLLRGLALAGGGGNVTAPHKQVAAATLDRATELVMRTRACNTFWADGTTVVGDNSDVGGFTRALENQFGPPAGQRILLIGAGGAARSVIAALAAAKCDRVDVLTRTAARIDELRRVADGSALTVAAFNAAARDDYDLAVHATPQGLAPSDPLPLEPALLERVHGVLDLVYHSGLTPLVRAARAAGLRAFDGTDMLLHQAAIAFELWWGRPAPLDVMRAALKDQSA